MKFSCISFLIFFFSRFSGFSAAHPDSLLQELSRTIEKEATYINEKNNQINQLKKRLQEDNLTLIGKFNLYNKLHYEYLTYKYDSAFIYSVKLQETARQLKEPVRLTYAKLKLGVTLNSSGMYKEALDSLHTVNLKPMPDSIKAEYYALMAKVYYDLSGYTDESYYSGKYRKAGGLYADSSLALLNQNNIRFYEVRGMKLKIISSEKARADIQTIIHKFNPTINQFAKAANLLGNIYYENGNTDKAIEMMTRAAIADIKGSVKEGVALMTLADYLYKNGDEARAYSYIKQAVADADFYGAKQRKIKLAAILPIIEGERLASVEEQHRRLIIYSAVVSLLTLLGVLFAVIIFRQLKQLREAKITVTNAYNKLQETNDKLTEANRIKEEYIGYSFNVYSDYLEKVDKFKKSIDQKLMVRQFDDINYVMKTINLKKEREALYQNFDKVFSRLFPNFVREFNTFFKEGDKIILKDKECLTIELRIFALIRLGISDHEQIARLLDYSVNTIYTYKTKVKTRSVLPNEEFERRVMEIKAF